MRENKGHARCNAFGIRYVFQNKEFDNLIIMDGDGEDRPSEIKSLISSNLNVSADFNSISEYLHKGDLDFTKHTWFKNINQTQADTNGYNGCQNVDDNGF